MNDSFPKSSRAASVPASTERAIVHTVACPRCGAALPDDATFCPFDATRLDRGASSNRRDSLVGMIVDERYEILGLLGEGGMGCVYRVRHRVLGRMFALKALRQELSSDWVTAERFVREARAAAAICHPNVITINDFGLLETGQPYFVMELLEGRTLSSLLRERRALTALEVLQLAQQIASALTAAHGAGVIHRDLKPDNIVLLSTTFAMSPLKVLDFGLAMVYGNQRLTRQGVVFGTPHYMSPEQASGEPFDARVDIYALGIMMHEALTGCVPFESDSYMGVLTKQLYAEPHPVSAVVTLSEAERPIEAIILKCLKKSPAERYSTMAELLADVAPLVARLTPAEEAESFRSRMPSARLPMESQHSSRRRDRRVRRVWYYAGLGTASLAVALVSLYLFLVGSW